MIGTIAYGTLYGPAVCCKPDVIDLEILVSRIYIRPVEGTVLLLGHHEYPRASDLILDKALDHGGALKVAP